MSVGPTDMASRALGSPRGERSLRRQEAHAASAASEREPARRAHSIQGTYIDELALTAGKLERSAHILAREKVPQGPATKLVISVGVDNV